VVLDGATLGVIFQGLATLAVALGLTAAGRSRRAAVDRGEYRTLQREAQAWASHGYLLESRLAGAGLPVPMRPRILEARYGAALSGAGGGDDGADRGSGASSAAGA